MIPNLSIEIKEEWFLAFQSLNPIKTINRRLLFISLFLFTDLASELFVCGHRGETQQLLYL